MPHVLVAGKVHPSGIALLESAPGFTFDYVEEVSEASYAPLVGRAEALVIRTQPLTALTIARAPKLRIVSRHGVGYDSVDVAALNERGIPLAVVGDVNSISVAEHAMMLLLAIVKRTLRADRSVRQGDWTWRNRLEPCELAGKRLLVIGYGRIGRHLARFAAAFGMDVRAYDPFLERRGWPEGPARPARDLKAALAWADAVSLNAPKTDGPVMGADEFAALKPGAILVNTARGGVIDESALLAALESGRVSAAGIDVFEDEPPDPDSPLLHLEQVILTPHIAGLTAEGGERMAVSSVQNVLDFFAGTIDPSLVVNWFQLKETPSSGANLHAK
jgi:D-3-phosphoglycerate dehydrogenase / 2-oxoglutarate reductase